MLKKIVPIGLSVLFLSAAGCQNKEKVAEKEIHEHDAAQMQRINEYERILEINPKDYEILVALGNVNYDMGKWKNAVDSYLKALVIDSTNVNVRTDLGTCYKQMGLLDLAEREFKKGIEIDPKHSKVHYNLGVIYYEKGELDKTLGEWEISYSLEKDPYFKEIAGKNIEQIKQALQDTTSLPPPRSK